MFSTLGALQDHLPVQDILMPSLYPTELKLPCWFKVSPGDSGAPHLGPPYLIEPHVPLLHTCPSVDTREGQVIARTPVA